MKYKLFSKNVKKDCSSCEFSRRLEFSDKLFCIKKGEVDTFNFCRKFKYNPLNREPDNKIIENNFTNEDFKI